jgi:uncharacterized membrane protein YgcG
MLLIINRLTRRRVMLDQMVFFLMCFFVVILAVVATRGIVGRVNKNRNNGQTIQNPWLEVIIHAEDLAKEFKAKFQDFLSLGDKYYIQKLADELRERESLILGKVMGKDVRIVKKYLPEYEKLIGAMDRYIADPDQHLLPKHYDFLDGSVLTDPVNLPINHPKLGRMTLKVNNNNYYRFTNPNIGAKYFRQDPAKRDPNQRYLVRSDDPRVKSLHEDEFDEFGVVRHAGLFDAICTSNGTEGNYIHDIGFRGQGGEFGGGGASGQISEDKSPVDHEHIFTAGRTADMADAAIISASREEKPAEPSSEDDDTKKGGNSENSTAEENEAGGNESESDGSGGESESSGGSDD